MEKKNISIAANILYNSRVRLKKFFDLPQYCKPQNNEEAYAIQNSLVKKYLSVDKKIFVIGKKIGCTNKAAQEQINISSPFYGNIFSTYSSKTSCSISSDLFFKPFIEPEFSFKMKKTLNFDKAPYTSNQIYDAIDSIIPSIEVVDSRYQDWTTVGINSLIADNGANAYWIYGSEKKNINQFDLSNHSVSLYINNTLISEGNASNVLKNPLNALSWLVNTMTLHGKSLPINSYISTGTCTPAIPVNKGDKINANFGTLGTVDFNLI
jgi:2-keto-4-pentenoate hydratase